MFAKGLAVALLAFGLTACTQCGGTSQPTADTATKPAGERVVNLYIWSDYTSKTLLDAFTAKTGIKVNEANYSSNEELLAKLQAGAAGFDLAVPSDYMVSVMTKLQLLQQLDKTKVPNAAHLEPNVLGKPYDPTNAYSLPYAWSLTGIAVHRGLYKDPVTSWADLLDNENPATKGRISLLDDVREVIGAALKFDGQSLNSVDDTQLHIAKMRLVAAKPFVKAFTSTPADLLTSDEVMLAHMYSGEALMAARDSGKPIEFVVPKEGATLAIDNMVLLKDAPHVEEAYALMNFLLEIDSNADFVTRTLFGPVVQGVKAKLPADVASNPNLFPPADLLAKCEMMQDLGDKAQTYDRLWSELKVQ